MDSLFSQLGIVIATATGFAILAKLFRQPPLVGYILTGITLGPLGANFLHDHPLFTALQQLGIVLLLFLVGMELDWNKAKHHVETSLAVGAVQMLCSFAVGLSIGFLYDFDLRSSLYLATALAFSSTVVTIKILSESRDLHSLYGRLTVGSLLFQDLVAIIATALFAGFAQPSQLDALSLAFFILIKAFALLAILWVLSQYVLPALFSRIARSSELLFLSSLAWCFLVSLTAYKYGFPLEIGGFLAGVSLASLPYSLDILNRLRSLRDFFLIILFVGLGSSFQLPAYSYLPLAALLLAVTLLFKPLVAFSSLVARGYKARPSFMAALSQGQLSELGIILVEGAVLNRLLMPALGTVLVFVAIVSLLASTVLLNHRQWLYAKLHHWLRRYEQSLRTAPTAAEEREEHIVIFGYHRMGYHILKKLRDLDHKVLVVDFNPDIIKRLKAQGIDCMYGDIQDEEILDVINAKQAAMIISTIPHREETAFLVEQVKKMHTQALLIVTSHHVDDALQYYKLGADYVILPHLLGGEHVADLITQYEHHSLVRFIHHRAEEIKLLRTRNHSLYYD